MATIVLTVNGATATKTISAGDAGRVLAAYGNPRGITTTQGMANSLMDDLVKSLKDTVVGYENALATVTPPAIT